MKRIVAQARKELTQLIRDRLALALALVLPVFQLLLMGQSMSFIVRDLPLVVQDFDDSPASRELIDGFRASLTFRIVAWPTDRRPEEAFTANAARGVVVIPATSSAISLVASTSRCSCWSMDRTANTAGLSPATPGASPRRSTRAAARRRAPVQAALRFWYNPGLSSEEVLRAGHLRDGPVDVPAAAGDAGHGARGRAKDDSAGLCLEHLGVRVPPRQGARLHGRRAGRGRLFCSLCWLRILRCRVRRRSDALPRGHGALHVLCRLVRHHGRRGDSESGRRRCRP